MDSNTIQRLVELLSDHAVLAICRDLEWMRQYGEDRDADDSELLMKGVKEALETIHGIDTSPQAPQSAPPGH